MVCITLVRVFRNISGFLFTISRKVLSPPLVSNQQTNEVGNFSDQLRTSSKCPTVGKGCRRKNSPFPQLPHASPLFSASGIARFGASCSTSFKYADSRSGVWRRTNRCPAMASRIFFCSTWVRVSYRCERSIATRCNNFGPFAYLQDHLPFSSLE